VFDAATASSPLLDPSEQSVLPQDAAGSVDQVATLSVRAGRSDLVFSASWTLGADVVGEIGIVEWSGGTARLSYWWSGLHGGTFRVDGTAPHQSVAITASWLTPIDPVCCPTRPYHFTVGTVGDGLGVTGDDRPWLGAYLTNPPGGTPITPSTGAGVVASIVPGSPAASALLEGDTIEAVNGRVPAGQFTGPGVVDLIAMAKAGETVNLTILRDTLTKHIIVELGSLADPLARTQSSLAGSAGYLI
jgi:hypothetical protein